MIVDDDPAIRHFCQLLLEAKEYEVLCAGDGFEGLAALKRSLPDVIISDLEMPNMSGFEFLSVVRRRFPAIPVIVISSAFSGLSIPETVLADAFFAKGAFTPEELFAKLLKLLGELPDRPKAVRPDKAAVWIRNDRGIIVVTCPQCLRTFPVPALSTGLNEAECDFCYSLITFEGSATPPGAVAE